jgi:hypothetical protein
MSLYTRSGLIVVDGSGAIFTDASSGPNYVADYFVSPSGNNANAGTTVGAPWAITAFLTTSTRWSLINGTGKKIGLMPGTYDVSGMMQADPVVGAIQWPGGSNSSNPTIIFSCDNSGNYSARSATINAKTAGGVYGGGSGISWNGPIVSHSGKYPSIYTVGNITIDGIIFVGYSYKALRIGGVSSSDGPGNLQGIIVKNCLFQNGAQNSGAGTDNFSALWMDGCNGALVQNNSFLNYTGPGGPTSGDHLNAIIYWSCINCVAEYNSCINSGNIYGKEIVNQGNEIRFNYIDASMYSFVGSANGIQDFTGANTAGLTLTSKIHHNIMLSSGFGIGGSTLNQNYGWSTPALFYNNTIVLNQNGTGPYPAAWVTAEVAGTITFYNNIYSGHADGSGYKSFHLNPGGPTLWDYNGFIATGMTWQLMQDATLSSVLGSYTTLASVQAAVSANGGISTFDTHSVASNTPLYVGSGTFPADSYQLQGGSPFKGTGSTTGTTLGSACDMGAWGYDPSIGAAPTKIGSDF